MKNKLLLLALAFIFSLPVPAEEAPPHQAVRGYYLGLGPVGLSNLNSSGIGYFFNGGYAFNYESTMLKLNAEVMGRAGALILNGGIGFSYFPSRLVFQELNRFSGLDFGFGTSRIRPNEAGLGEWTT